jgi:hypothetical protein
MSWSYRWGQTTPLNCVHRRVYCSSPRWCMNMESHGGIISTGKKPHLCLHLLRVLWGFMVKILYAFTVSYTCSTCPTHWILRDTVTPIIFVKEYTLWSSSSEPPQRGAGLGAKGQEKVVIWRPMFKKTGAKLYIYWRVYSYLCYGSKITLIYFNVLILLYFFGTCGVDMKQKFNTS